MDQKTIKLEPITSQDLMERASERISEWIATQYPDPETYFHIFCGPGNNGGDGMAVARMLSLQHKMVVVYFDSTESLTKETQTNLQRLPTRSYLSVVDISKRFDMPKDGIIIDALFGSGLSRPLGGKWENLVEKINACLLPVVAIDIPSGVFADEFTSSQSVHAHHTLCLQTPKLACFQRENAPRVGKVVTIDIGLHQPTLDNLEVYNCEIDRQMVKASLPVRNAFDHKGTFGHALLICGGYGKVGAALLAARACLRTGVGKLSIHAPKSAYQVVQAGAPEAMVEVDDHEYWFAKCPEISGYQAVGIGCGLGQKSTTAQAIRALLDRANQPLVLDADALNIISKHESWLSDLPPDSVLTPHPGEYARLFEPTDHSFDRLEQQRELSKSLAVFIIYKGAHTCITTPSGIAYFNSTGNPGMATAGSGDVLTGMITGLMAQKIPTEEAVYAAVYLHGLAGDMAAEKVGQYSLIASDIIDHIGPAILKTTIDGD